MESHAGRGCLPLIHRARSQQLTSSVPKAFYKPLATRTPVLITYLLAALALLILTEYACRRIPQHDGLGGLSMVMSNTLGALRPRADDGNEKCTFIRPAHVARICWYYAYYSKTPPVPFFKELDPQIHKRSSLTSTFHSITVGTPSSGLRISPSAGTDSTTSTASPIALVTGTTPGPRISPGGDSLSTTTKTTISKISLSAPRISPGGGSSSIVMTPSSATTSAPHVSPVAGYSTATASSPRISPGGGSSSTTPTVSPTVTVPASTFGPRISPGGGSSSIIMTSSPVVISLPRVSPTAGYSTATASSPRISPGGEFSSTIPTASSILSETRATTGPRISPVSGSTILSQVDQSPGTVTSVAITKLSTSIFTSTKLNGNIAILSTTIPITTEVVLTTVSAPTTTSGLILTSIAITELSTSFYTSTRTDGSVTILGNKIPFTTTEAVWTTISPIYPVSTTVNTSGTYIVMSDGSSQTPPDIDVEQYIIVAFLPMILALIFTLPWRIIDKTIREMEPFYQLQHSYGVAAEKSLLLDYSTSLLVTLPFKAISRGHYFVLMSSIVSLAVLMITPLSSELLFVSMIGECTPSTCNGTWGIYVVVARAIEGILGSIIFLLVVMIIFNFKRKSGVYANPLSIAGLGTLFQNPDTLQELAALDSRLNSPALKEALAGRMYKIAWTAHQDGTSSYGIAGMRWFGEFGNAPSFYGSRRGKYDRLDGSGNLHIENKSRFAGLRERLLQVTAFVLIAGSLIIIVYYHWTSGDTGFERFMDSQGFGVRLFMAVLGVGVKLCWSTIDDDLRRLEPYRRLLRGSVKPEDSILIHTYMSPLSSLIPSLRRGHFLVFAVSFTAVLAELLPVTFATTPYSPAVAGPEYTVSTFVAITILGLMIINLSILIFRPSHGLKQLPRTPTTIASVLLYLATEPSYRYGGMMYSLGGMELMRTNEIHKRVVGMGRLYGLGWVMPGDLRIEEEDKIQRT